MCIRDSLKPIAKLSSEVPETVLGVVASVSETPISGGRRMIRAELVTESGPITLVWFNQRYIKDKLAGAERVLATGKVSGGYRKQMAVTDFELLSASDDLAQFQRILPVYRATEKINAKLLRRLIEQAVMEYGQYVQEYLPEQWLDKYHMMPLQEALREIHFPSSWPKLNEARYRLVMDEFTLMLLGLQSQTIAATECAGIAHAPTERLTNQFLQSLPFRLTGAQRRVILEIKGDMESPRVMQRLLQGDVGSGKTMVAAYTLLKAAEGG